jgi:hypothetical protein
MAGKKFQVMVTYYNYDGSRISSYLRNKKFDNRQEADNYAKSIESDDSIILDGRKIRARSIITGF